MPRFVLVTRLDTQGLQSADSRRAQGKAWLEKAKKACPEVKWLAHYSLLGPYDFMDIYEAPDVETAHRISLLSRAEGASSAESWQALPYEDYLKVLKELGD